MNILKKIRLKIMDEMIAKTGNFFVIKKALHKSITCKVLRSGVFLLLKLVQIYSVSQANEFMSVLMQRVVEIAVFIELGGPSNLP